MQLSPVNIINNSFEESSIKYLSKFFSWKIFEVNQKFLLVESRQQLFVWKNTSAMSIYQADSSEMDPWGPILTFPWWVKYNMWKNSHGDYL